MKRTAAPLILLLAVAVSACSAVRSASGDAYCAGRTAGGKCSSWQIGPSEREVNRFNKKQKNRRAFPAAPSDDDIPTTDSEGVTT